MKTNIENSQEFNETIDQYGELLDAIAEKERAANLLKALLEAYANDNRIAKARTERYSFQMQKAKPSLRCRPGLSEQDVAALLKKDAVMREFVTLGYNSPAIKAHVAQLDDPNEALEPFGLFLTSPARHAVLKAV